MLLEQIVRTRQRHLFISSAITRNCLTVILKTLGNHTKTLGNAHNARQPSKMLDCHSKSFGDHLKSLGNHSKLVGNRLKEHSDTRFLAV